MGFPLPLLRLRLSSGTPPCPGLRFYISRKHKNIGEDRILFKLPLVSTYHYERFQNVKFYQELVKVFLPRTLPPVLVGIMNQRQATQRTANHIVADNIFETLVKRVAGMDNRAHKVIHRTVNFQVFCQCHWRWNRKVCVSTAKLQKMLNRIRAEIKKFGLVPIFAALGIAREQALGSALICKKFRPLTR